MNSYTELLLENSYTHHAVSDSKYLNFIKLMATMLNNVTDSMKIPML